MCSSLSCVLIASVVSCAEQRAETPRVLVDVFPGVRALPGERVVEIDALTTPFFDTFIEGDIFLELIACSPDSKEHETLLICGSKASQIHAAMLLAGFTPGSPTDWSRAGAGGPVPARGDRLRVVLVYEDADGRPRTVAPSAWVVNEQTGERLPDVAYVFAGSRMVRYQGETRYDADYTGTLIGLASFGSELIAFPDPISPEASIDEPVWIADEDSVPAGEVRVVIRITGAD